MAILIPCDSAPLCHRASPVQQPDEEQHHRHDQQHMDEEGRVCRDDVRVLDHIVVSGTEAVSMAERGLL